MTKKEHIEYWIKTSEQDMKSAIDIFESGKYDWSLFISHLAIEKILKGLWVKDNENNIPPKIHNLLKLVEQTKIDLSNEKKKLIFEVTRFNIEARYPDYKFDFYKKCTKDFAKDYLIKIRELHKCIRKKI